MPFALQDIRKQKLHNAERIIYLIAAVLICIDLFLIYWKSAVIDWPAYLWLCFVTLCLFACGIYYRISERSERIASALICTGGLVFFTMALSVFNYLLLPIVNSPIDAMIASWDSQFGFYWPDVMNWAAENPVITQILKLAYITTMPQLAVLVVVLGLMGRQKELHILILSVVISATLAICFWGIFPSFGASSLYKLTPDIWAAVAPVLDFEYASELNRIAAEGPGRITPEEIRGLIGFPSYHGTLAFIAIMAARNIKYVSWVFLVTNLLIIPATFVQGGHHLLDPVGGFVLFVFSYQIASRTVSGDFARKRIPDIIPA